jgi:hypothetical protein
MKLITAILAILLCGNAIAAVPDVSSVAPTRTSFYERGCVVFDGTAITSDLTNDFISLLNTVNFGDAAAGNWSNGNSNRSKNGYFGAGVAAHCYATAGSKSWSWQAFDGTNRATKTGTITVSAFTGANTYCISSNSLPVAGEGGCPSGATGVQQSDFTVILASATYIATNKRVLLKAGDVFTGTAENEGSASYAITNKAGPILIGSYGAANNSRAIIRPTCSVNYATVFPLKGTTNDIRIVDIEIDGQGDAQCQAVIGQGSINKIYFDNLYIHDLGGGIEIYLQAATAVYDQIFLTNSHIFNLVQSGGSSYTHGILVGATNSAIMGNLFDTSTAASAEHMIRVQYLAKGVISNNTIKNVAAGKEMIALRAPCSAACPTGSGEYYGAGGSPDLGLTGALAATRFVSVQDNDIRQNTTAGIVLKGVNPNDSTIIEDVVIERNYVVMGAAGVGGIQTQGARIYARSNLVDMTNATDPNTGTQITGATAGTAASSASIHCNNSIYNGTGSGTDYGVQVQSGVTTSTVCNNLVYFPNSKSGAAINDSGTGTTLQTNTGNIGTLLTSPAFDGPLTEPKGFRISTASYAATGGTAVFPASNDDFFNCNDVTANVHIGAFVPRARATCRGVK